MLDFTIKLSRVLWHKTTLHPNENIYAGHMIIDEHIYTISHIPISFQLYGSDNIETLLFDNQHQNLHINSNTNHNSEQNNAMNLSL